MLCNDLLRLFLHSKRLLVSLFRRSTNRHREGWGGDQSAAYGHVRRPDQPSTRRSGAGRETRSRARVQTRPGWPGPATHYPAGRPAPVTSKRKQQPRRAAAAAPIQPRSRWSMGVGRGLPPLASLPDSPSPPRGGPVLESLRRGRVGSGVRIRAGRGARARAHVCALTHAHVPTVAARTAAAAGSEKGAAAHGTGEGARRCRRIGAGPTGRPCSAPACMRLSAACMEVEPPCRVRAEDR